jgi:multiple sugar transport system permease protein
MNAAPVRRRHTGRTYLNPRTLILVTVLAVLSFFMAFPFIWMVSASLKVPATAFKLPPELWPYEWRFENYAAVIANPYVPIPLFFLNSIKIATLVTLGQLTTCTLAGYAFARLRFPLRNTLFLLFLTSLMVPAQVTIIPTFIIMRTFGLVNTHASLIVPALTSVFGVFMLRQFFMTIPDELEDAARLDGAGPWRILWQVMVPLIGPGLSTLAVITFIGSWNAFFGPLIFLSDWDKMTWPLGMAVLRGQYGEGSVAVQMAGISLAVVPVAIIFILGQRFIIESITFTGIKG